MSASWKLSARLLPAGLPRQGIDGARARSEVPVAISEAQDGWLIEAWLADEPDRARRAALGEPFAIGPDDWALTALPDTDWVGESERAVAPVSAGRFRIRTPRSRGAGDRRGHDRVRHSCRAGVRHRAPPDDHRLPRSARPPRTRTASLSARSPISAAAPACSLSPRCACGPRRARSRPISTRCAFPRCRRTPNATACPSARRAAR